MKTIRLVTFKGCQSTVDLRTALEEPIEAGQLDARLEVVMVPSPTKALESGLAGSPTLFVDGVEYQAERRGEPGFY